MKKTAFLILCMAVVLVSCKNPKDILDIPFSFSISNNFTLPKAANQEYTVPDSVVSVTTPSITNTIPAEFSKKNANINSIKSLSIESIVLNITSPTTQTFAFMKSVNIYMGATGLGKTLIATKDNINTITPASGTLNLTAQNADISAYLKSPSYFFVLETAIVKTYTQDIAITSEVSIKVVANPLN